MPTASFKKRSKRRNIVFKAVIFVSLSTISLLTLLMGTGLFLIKSPTQKAELYAAMVDQYQTQLQTTFMQPSVEVYLKEQSLDLAVKAVQVNPEKAESWKILAQQFAQTDQIDQAMKARDVAILLGLQDISPVTTMQTLMPERNLALSKVLVSNTIKR